MADHYWLPLSPSCMDCGAYRHGAEARQPCPGMKENDDD